jgi:hypothetical protein
MLHKDALLCSKEPATGFCHELDDAVHILQPCFLKIDYNPGRPSRRLLHVSGRNRPTSSTLRNHDIDHTVTCPLKGIIVEPEEPAE